MTSMTEEGFNAEPCVCGHRRDAHEKNRGECALCKVDRVLVEDGCAEFFSAVDDPLSAMDDDEHLENLKKWEEQSTGEAKG